MSKFTFIDLFAGIGGFHIAMESLGGKCVFASEIDRFARLTYEQNFRKSSPDLFEDDMFNEDIRTISPDDIPDFDVLCAGFPCQPFSQAGYKRGFDDNHDSERGNLFFNIAEIIEHKRPRAFFLENVRGIVNHDNGKTFQTIRSIIEDELNYSFHYKVVKASDYGLPQLRPRTFMIGFRDEGVLSGFVFPPSKPLRFNMSDVWGGECSREIGFTLRVGGRGSNINDRRNWDSYLVDGEVKRLTPTEAKMMQGFPKDFEFHISDVQAMKQLGNSVAIDAVRECGKSMISYMNTLQAGEDEGMSKKNKGEWAELYSFFKFIKEQKLILANSDLTPSTSLDHFKVSKVSTLNIDKEYFLADKSTIHIFDKKSGQKLDEVFTPDIITQGTLLKLANAIRIGSGTFNIDELDVVQSRLGLSFIQGGHSTQKSDIILDISNKEVSVSNEGFSIKSYLGSSPTLLNASGNTNFIYEVVGISQSFIDDINSINTNTKLIDRLTRIKDLNGSLKFSKVERDTMQYNLAMIDNTFPEIMAQMLLEFYTNRTSTISENTKRTFDNVKTLCADQLTLEVRVKRFLVSTLLGMFPGQCWDGKKIAKGAIVVKENGDQVGFHVIDESALEDFLFSVVRFETPSTTRHRYGSVYQENDGKIYFKLNLQLRM